MPSPRLTIRALNRATLARQLLLERRAMAPIDAVEHLVGMQAQVPTDPYTALWSRLRDFDPHALSALLEQRQLVRTTVMRGTLHLVSARDALAIRPMLQPVLAVIIQSNFRRQLGDVNRDEVVKAARELVETNPRTPGELGRLLAERFPKAQSEALRWAAQAWLPMVQVTPRGMWTSTARAANTTYEAWLGTGPAKDGSPDELILRYLAAFGPATHRDAATWSRLPALGEVFDRLRPRLRVLTDDQDRELFDVPDAPLPDPDDTPAPARFLPEYDNVLLSHADRSRFVPAGASRWWEDSAFIPRGTVLIDGFLGGVWRLDQRTLNVRIPTSTPGAHKTAVDEEAHRLVNFLADAPNAKVAISHI